MRLFFMDLDGQSPHNFPVDIFLSQGSGVDLFSQFVDTSLHRSRNLFVPGSLVVHEAFKRISKFAGAFLLRSNQKALHNLSAKCRGFRACPRVEHRASTNNLVRLWFCSASRLESVFLGNIASKMTHIWKELGQLHSFPVLSLAAALVPPFDNLSRRVLAMTTETSDVLINTDRTHCTCGHQGSSDLSFHRLNWTRDAVEPVTGIKFPTVVDNSVDGESYSTLSSEVLVGTGSRSMRIFKVKSLKIYAFGLYVRPDLICKKLGQKYASVPVGELNNQREFFDDLLREDIHMSLRLVVNCSGLKISTVRDAFEKSLRARLLKMNPKTDYQCLQSFDSYFSQDIPLPPGTTIKFQQTADGQLITEIGGKQMGAVHSKDLCRAFFGMYIGDIPVSIEAKEEIAKNVGSIIRRC